MSTKPLVYEPYNKKSFIVHGDRARYAKLMKTVGGRWNSSVKSNPGWTVPREREEELKKLIEALPSVDVPQVQVSKPEETSNRDKVIDDIETHVRSRKQQKKYHRAISESNDSEDDNQPVKKSVEEQIVEKEKLKFEEEKKRFEENRQREKEKEREHVKYQKKHEERVRDVKHRYDNSDSSD